MLQRQVAEYHAAEVPQKISVSHAFRANPIIPAASNSSIALSASTTSPNPRTPIIQTFGWKGESAVNATTGEALPDCRGALKYSMGLPCAHESKGMARGEPIVLSAIATHWNLSHASVAVIPAVNASTDNRNFGLFQRQLQIVQSAYKHWSRSEQVVALRWDLDYAEGKILALSDPPPLKGTTSRC
ncbi:hypothetical protein K3495_g6932 [Podosphaera aphanis]|nr:hypothetical protein K3495_g6932 [Podosphaera aphanis]